MLRLVQITDTHLFASADGELHGVRADATLARIIAHVVARAPAPDLILATGDLVQEELPASYERVKAHFRALPAPVYCLPGNHDDKALLRKLCASANVHWQSVLVREPWQIIMLDSTKACEPGGHLADRELELLDRALARRPGLHALVCLHHQPLPINSLWLDTMVIDNGDELLRRLQTGTPIKAVVFGHVHQEFQALHNSVPLYAAPSTCLQFMPGAAESSYDPRPPGYRWIELHEDGHMETGISRVP